MSTHLRVIADAEVPGRVTIPGTEADHPNQRRARRQASRRVGDTDEDRRRRHEIRFLRRKRQALEGDRQRLTKDRLKVIRDLGPTQAEIEARRRRARLEAEARRLHALEVEADRIRALGPTPAEVDTAIGQVEEAIRQAKLRQAADELLERQRRALALEVALSGIRAREAELDRLANDLANEIQLLADALQHRTVGDLLGQTQAAAEAYQAQVAATAAAFEAKRLAELQHKEMLRRAEEEALLILLMMDDE
jgi:hypothetical protein